MNIVYLQYILQKSNLNFSLLKIDKFKMNKFKGNEYMLTT